MKSLQEIVKDFGRAKTLVNGGKRGAGDLLKEGGDLPLGFELNTRLTKKSKGSKN